MTFLCLFFTFHQEFPLCMSTTWQELRRIRPEEDTRAQTRCEADGPGWRNCDNHCLARYRCTDITATFSFFFQDQDLKLCTLPKRNELPPAFIQYRIQSQDKKLFPPLQYASGPELLVQISWSCIHVTSGPQHASLKL
jgi:hypothetical protein